MSDPKPFRPAWRAVEHVPGGGWYHQFVRLDCPTERVECATLADAVARLEADHG